MRIFGLIGNPLTHSFSKKYFEEKFQREAILDAVYELFPLTSVDEVHALVHQHPDLCGLNVTIPFKRTVIPFLSETDSQAKSIGAVNCLKIKQGKLLGYNTDVYGFERSLERLLRHRPAQCFILGSGGSSKAVAFVLHRLNLPYIIVSRQPAKGGIPYSDIANKMKADNLFINCTPLGMFPSVETLPDIPYHLLGTNDYLFDLVYNPSETSFLREGKKKKSAVMNGWDMLKNQAERSWEIWNG